MSRRPRRRRRQVDLVPRSPPGGGWKDRRESNGLSCERLRHGGCAPGLHRPVAPGGAAPAAAEGPPDPRSIEHGAGASRPGCPSCRAGYKGSRSRGRGGRRPCRVSYPRRHLRDRRRGAGGAALCGARLHRLPRAARRNSQSPCPRPRGGGPPGGRGPAPGDPPSGVHPSTDHDAGVRRGVGRGRRRGGAACLPARQAGPTSCLCPGWRRQALRELPRRCRSRTRWLGASLCLHLRSARGAELRALPRRPAGRRPLRLRRRASTHLHDLS